MEKKKVLAVLLVLGVLIISAVEAAETTKASGPHIGISGSLFTKVPNGEWTCLLEQAVIFMKTNNGQVWLFNFGTEGRKGKMFQSLLMKKSGKEMCDFVSLDYKHVQQEKYLSWQEIKAFLKKNMPPDRRTALVKAIEDYLCKQGLL